ncbi:hypothetical protein [Phaffia rhodozyma]|uniref:Uncharacterized protein n=1 Tax=Phaffia rhodozyma TaxID=264483 RepID=A0A0F7SS53_PHARH|nr:hypothetical protein [Phaffia rhodozyma]
MNFSYSLLVSDCLVSYRFRILPPVLTKSISLSLTLFLHVTVSHSDLDQIFTGRLHVLFLHIFLSSLFHASMYNLYLFLIDHLRSQNIHLADRESSPCDLVLGSAGENQTGAFGRNRKGAKKPVEIHTA